MHRKLAILGGFGLGVSCMYILDPARGRRRRVLLLDKGVRAWRTARVAARKTVRDARNRSVGLWHAMTAGIMGTDRRSDDEVLAARVRSKCAGLVRHPRSLNIETEEGLVILSGPIVADEVERVIACVQALPGVRDVENLLEVYEHEEGVPGLQGEGRHRVRPTVVAFDTPTSKLVTGAAGAALLVLGWRLWRNGSGVALFK
jgi:hypothetical protein